jgi:hypothetical protein
LGYRSLQDDLTALYHIGVRNVCFAEEMTILGMELSRAWGKTLVVRFDGRMGLHSAILCEGGDEVRVFGEEDEIYALYAENGELLVEGTHFTLEEARSYPDSNAEFEVVKGAIELGVEEFGKGTWIEVLNLVDST